MYYALTGKIYRTFSNIFHLRLRSYPFISGDDFRSIADYVYENGNKCHASKINRNGSVIFVESHLIHEWFQLQHPLIMHTYKLITHNSDAVVGEKETSYIDDKIIHWFAQNNIVSHPKITPIPIGIENKRWFMSGWMLTRCIAKLKKKALQRKSRILVGFNIQTNPKERSAILAELRKNPSVDEVKTHLRPVDYFALLNAYDFVASPQGNGPDCHRTWEALYLGVTPIVTQSVFAESFKKIGIPLQTVESWGKIDTTMSQISRDIMDIPALHFDYWKDTIMKK